MEDHICIDKDVFSGSQLHSFASLLIYLIYSVTGVEPLWDQVVGHFLEVG